MGIDGRKAARNFSSVKQGRVKQKYSCRKVFWDVITQMLRHGTIVEVAIDRVYEVD